MGNEAETEIPLRIIPLLRDYIESSTSAWKESKKVNEETNRALEKTSECLTSLKLEFRTLKVKFEETSIATKDRVSDCTKKHDMFSEQLKHIPSKEVIKLRDDKIDNMGEEINKT